MVLRKKLFDSVNHNLFLIDDDDDYYYYKTQQIFLFFGLKIFKMVQFHASGGYWTWKREVIRGWA